MCLLTPIASACEQFFNSLFDRCFFLETFPCFLNGTNLSIMPSVSYFKQVQHYVAVLYFSKLFQLIFARYVLVTLNLPLSPLIFIMVIDRIMRETVKQGQNGIQRTFTKQLDDLDFADDCLLSHSLKQMQKKSSKLMQEAEKTGLKINIPKTKLLKDIKVNCTQQAKVQLKGKI